MSKVYLITGGCGFIGSALVRQLLLGTQNKVINVDKLSYAGNPDAVASVANHPNYIFEKVDITDETEITRIFAQYRPDFVMHLAAESHVDNSISNPRPFIETNVLGTFVLVHAALSHFKTLTGEAKKEFRFLHISTDEVFGHLGLEGYFSEATPYNPSSPYSASKAASDHLVRAWGQTYGLPILITNCSNNYGPWQFPEKLIPVVIHSALNGRPIPVYGQGANVRDWLYVDDHVSALLMVIQKGRLGETYCVGSHGEKKNIELVKIICTILDELRPSKDLKSYASLISYVTDRPGHDFRYAIEPQKLESEIGWKAKESFESGMKKTIQWYLDNQDWVKRMMSKQQV